MRAPSLLLPALLAAPATFLQEKDTAPPPGHVFERPLAPDWDAVPVDGEATVADHRTVADGAEARVRWLALRGRARPLEALAKAWRPQMENGLAADAARTTTETSFRDLPALRVDARDAAMHVSWTLFRWGDRTYVFWARRTGALVDDEAVARDIRRFRDALRLTGAPAKTAPPPPEPARKVELPHWRLACVKPAGLRRIETFDESERANGIVLELAGEAEQARCVIRVYARRRGTSGHEPLKTMVERRVAQWRERMRDATQVRAPVRDKAFSPPLAKETARVVLKGLRRRPETTTWLFAECRNRVQYQVEIHVAGPDVFADAVKAFVRSFRPVSRRTRLGGS